MIRNSRWRNIKRREQHREKDAAQGQVHGFQVQLLRFTDLSDAVHFNMLSSLCKGSLVLTRSKVRRKCPRKLLCTFLYRFERPLRISSTVENVEDICPAARISIVD